MAEVLALIMIFGVFPSILFTFIVRLKQAKYAASAGTGDGLRASELKRIIREAVEEAVEPLEDRIAELESALDASGVTLPDLDRQPQLDPALLADDLEGDFGDDLPAAVERRTRA